MLPPHKPKNLKRDSLKNSLRYLLLKRKCELAFKTAIWVAFNNLKQADADLMEADKKYHTAVGKYENLLDIADKLDFWKYYRDDEQVKQISNSMII
tara:strand:- start:1568 stop:1855 length:288 start_codon:yes stop_codon:yes gene_type:complete